MPDITLETMRLAWEALWTKGKPYHLSSAIQEGERVKHVWFRSLDSLSLPRTGSIVLLNQEPWGVVSIDLVKNELSQLSTISNEGFEFDQAKGTFSGHISFSELKLAGDYVVHRGKATGSAVKLAVKELGIGNAADDSNITMAKDYQQELINDPSGSGRFMVGTYYDNNDSYVKCFDNSAFVTLWKTNKTNGKDTAYFAGHTANAASTSNRGTVQVNGDPDYNSHAWKMQNYLVSACIAQQTDEGNAAATAASTFGNYASEDDLKQTVNNVMSTVQQTTPPPSLKDAIRNAPKRRDPLAAEDRANLQPGIDAIFKEEDDVRRGILIREQTERPISGMYRSYFKTGALTISGVLRGAANGEFTVECTGVSGSSPEVDVTIGVFPGKLHGEVQNALDKADFLKAVLGKRVISALAGPDFLSYVSRMLTLVVGQKMGPLNG